MCPINTSTNPNFCPYMLASLFMHVLFLGPSNNNKIIISIKSELCQVAAASCQVRVCACLCVCT